MRSAILRKDAIDHADEFERYDIRIKCYDVYFSSNAAFIWIDTLYPELDDEAWRYGLALRSRYTDELCRRYMSPGGILQAIAPEVMTKLGAGFEFIKLLKRSLDPNFILNPGRHVPGTGGEPWLDHREPARLASATSMSCGTIVYQCNRCGQCLDFSTVGQAPKCPAFEGGLFESYAARGKYNIARALVDGVLDYDEDIAERVYGCTECRACAQDCFKYLDTTAMFTVLKEDLAHLGLIPENFKPGPARPGWARRDPQRLQGAPRRAAGLAERPQPGRQARRDRLFRGLYLGLRAAEHVHRHRRHAGPAGRGLYHPGRRMVLRPSLHGRRRAGQGAPGPGAHHRPIPGPGRASGWCSTAPAASRPSSTTRPRCWSARCPLSRCTSWS